MFSIDDDIILTFDKLVGRMASFKLSELKFVNKYELSSISGIYEIIRI
jgi:hypothetical protein